MDEQPAARSTLMTFPVDLEVTINSKSFAESWGLDPDGCDLSNELRVMAGDDCVAFVADYGTTLANAEGRLRRVGATVEVDLGREHKGSVGVLGGDFTTATVHLLVRVDPVRFAGTYGLDPRDAAAEFIAADLLGMNLMRDHDGTVTPLGLTLGRACRCEGTVACTWTSACVRCGGERTDESRVRVHG